jgi:hypothetical protein
MHTKLPALGLLVLALSLFTVACGSNEPPGDALLPIGVLDSPHEGDTLSGPIQFRGWALSEDGIQSASLFVDRRMFKTGQIKLSRPDVASAHTDFPEAGHSGFEINLNPGEIPPGKHLCSVQVKSGKGLTRDVGVVNIIVQR